MFIDLRCSKINVITVACYCIFKLTIIMYHNAMLFITELYAIFVYKVQSYLLETIFRISFYFLSRLIEKEFMYNFKLKSTKKKILFNQEETVFAI